MRTETLPDQIPTATGMHLVEPLLDHARVQPDMPLLSRRVGEVFVPLTAAQVLSQVRRIARGLIASGVRPSDRVALMSRTRVEWALLDYAILCAGAVTVPIFETSSAEQIEWIIGDSGAVAAVFETEDMHRAYAEVADRLPACSTAIVLERDGLEMLNGRADEVPETELDRRLAVLGPEHLATIIYTSGTTGRPKGCVLTHGNLRTNARQVTQRIADLFEPTDSTLLFLPLAHSFAKILFLVPMELGMPVAFCDDMQRLPEDLVLARPTWLAAVPRVFEKVYASAHHKAFTEGRQRIFEHAADVASRWSRAQDDGHVAIGLRAQHRVFDALVYRKIRDAFGGRLRFAFSGGGPLSDGLTHFFNGVDIQVYEGYGLTETSPVLTMNRPGDWRIGTVGRALPRTTIRIAADGEILAAGPQVFSGYWRDVHATGQSFTGDGFLLTGDLGEVDDAGYVRITGRKKELIVTAGGKNVAPTVLEDRLKAHPLISQALVVGDARPYIAALVALDEEALGDWLADQDRPPTPVGQLGDDPRLREEIATAVEAANSAVSRAESIRRFAILDRDFSVESGDLTPTFKLRRLLLHERHAADIEDLYA